ncbi:hypothetical protein C8Q70DRAFT_1038449 [Cubamyces menziesii]|nr:hypothetical protein C8Q70DRAFT_1038449 [Cubamyces menziesii]
MSLRPDVIPSSAFLLSDKPRAARAQTTLRAASLGMARLHIDGPGRSPQPPPHQLHASTPLQTLSSTHPRVAFVPFIPCAVRIMPSTWSLMSVQHSRGKCQRHSCPTGTTISCKRVVDRSLISLLSWQCRLAEQANFRPTCKPPRSQARQLDRAHDTRD